MSTNETFLTSSVHSVSKIKEPVSPLKPALRVGESVVHIQRLSPQVRITPQARKYAIAELARRAGVPPEIRNCWAIRVEADRTIVDILPEGQAQIIFPHASPMVLQELSAGRIHTVTRGWMSHAKSARGKEINDFRIPYSHDSETSPQPLFILRTPTSVECTVDLPLSILLNLSRWEETLPVDTDAHSRFPARRSAAYEGMFLNRPVVDEYAFAFEEALQCLLPTWEPPEKKLRIKLSHDADHIGIPFRWKDAIRHTTHHRKPHYSARDLLSSLTETESSDLQALREIVGFSLERGLDSAVYWKASLPGPEDSGYDPRHRKVQKVIEWIAENGMESGVQPGYETFRSPEKLRREVQVLREALGQGPLGGRQHYLRWCPDTWLHWENCGLAYDSTLCFAEQVGFRAGTCIPYRPWLFSLNREADLLEIPLLVMDRTLLGYMKLDLQQSIAVVRDCLNRCRAVGGVFTLVWHNNNLLDPIYRSLYLGLLPLLQQGEKYNWKSEYSSIFAGQK